MTIRIAKDARQLPLGLNYKVYLTKTTVNECPTFEKPVYLANEIEATSFVSIHINAAAVVPMTSAAWPLAHGTSTYYNIKKSASFNLADAMARSVSTNLGVNNRGVVANEGLIVLKLMSEGVKTAVLLEAARLSGSDELKLHASNPTMRIAEGAIPQSASR